MKQSTFRFFKEGMSIGEYYNETVEKRHLNFNDSELLFKEVKKRINTESDYYLFLLGLTTGIHSKELFVSNP
jgi:hypothetical protein